MQRFFVVSWTFLLGDPWQASLILYFRETRPRSVLQFRYKGPSLQSKYVLSDGRENTWAPSICTDSETNIHVDKFNKTLLEN